MGEVGRLVDALGMVFTGGSANANPDASLGGVVSSTRVRGPGPVVDVQSQIPSIRLANIFPACGEGDLLLNVDANGDLVFTPPGGAAGTPVTIAAGESKVLAGVDVNKAVVVDRDSWLEFANRTDAVAKNPLNGALSMQDVTDAQRTAGVTTYRGLALQARGIHGVLNIRLWFPAVAGAQAVYSLGTELVVGGSIQTIADELTAPAAVSFVSPTTEATALTIPVIDPGDFLGLWIRKVIPAAGSVAVQENMQLAMKYLGA